MTYLLHSSSANRSLAEIKTSASSYSLLLRADCRHFKSVEVVPRLMRN